MRQIVVTGGGTGIGYAVAAGFVRAGEQVTITGRREQVLKEAVASLAGLVSAAGPGMPAAGYACFDAADPAAVAAALPQLPGQVDVLVNNAGGRGGVERGRGPRAGPRGITANVVSPGLTLGSEFFQGTLTEERKQRLIAETRTGRPGTTEDVAAVVTFLASPSAGHLTGQVIHVNGGAYLGL